MKMKECAVRKGLHRGIRGGEWSGVRSDEGKVCLRRVECKTKSVSQSGEPVRGVLEHVY